MISAGTRQSSDTQARRDPSAGIGVPWWRRPVVLVGVPLILGLIHVAVVAPHYFVGSFDDDSGYILTARALLSGEGLSGHVANGTLVSGSYLPGYPALLVPLLWIWSHTYVPLRLLSVASFAALFPLTWIYLGRRRVGDGARTATLVLLALGPPLATFGSMVMAETPFLVLLVVLLILLDHWDEQPQAWTWTGVGVVVATAGLVWLKEAGIGVAIGVVLWVLFRRSPIRRQKTLLVAIGVGVLLLPVLIIRLAHGLPVAGTLYSQQLGTYYSGGLAGRLVHVAPHSVWQMLSTAIPATLLPYLSPLPLHGHDPDLWKVLSWQVSVLTVVGAVVWARRYRDSAIVIAPAYLAMTLLWPDINERRVILVLPIVTAWYVLGGLAVWHKIRDWARSSSAAPRLVEAAGASPGRASSVTLTVTAASAALVVAAAVAVPLAFQFPRDYLFAAGQNSSQFEGSRYSRLLSQLGSPSQVVETSYLSSTALFTGHRTANNAFLGTLTTCQVPAIRNELAADDAGFLLLGNLNKFGQIDGPCLWSVAKSSDWAVPLLHTSRDNATVFELIGPGTAHPNLQDLVGSATQSGTTGLRAVNIEEWDWGRAEPVNQVTVGTAGAPGATTSVVLQLRGPDGSWRTVARAGASVGDGRGAAPFLLATLPPGTTATAVRVMVAGSPAAGGGTVADVHALGPVGAS